MPEQFSHQPDEEEPALRLSLDGMEVIATRDNSSLFTFAGRLSSRNHVFIVHEQEVENEEEKKEMYSYIFSLANGFDAISDYMWTHDYPLHLNLPEVQECDESAFQRFIAYYAHKQGETIPDELPDDFI